MHPLDAPLVEALPPESLYAVGGRVRDELRAAIEGHPAATLDADYVVVGVPLSDLLDRLSPLGRVDLVGASFAVIKFSAGGMTVDIATPRREHSIGPGHRDFHVESGPEVTIEEDLGRRDFRMNMLARALPSGRILDPYGGEGDIRARRIDILTGSAFREDPLRMLRAAQFAARFHYEVTPQVRAAMTEAAPLVVTVSPERVQDELIKLLSASKPSIGFALLQKTGVLGHLWPELAEGVGVEQNEWHAYDVWLHTLAALDAAPPDDLVLRLATLLHDVGKPRTKVGPHFYRHEIVGAEMAQAMLERIRFSNDIVQTTEHLVRNHMYSADPHLSDAGIRRFIRRIGSQHIERLFALREADIVGSGLPRRDGSNELFQSRVRDELARKPAFSIRELAIGGDDVVAALVRRGDAQAGFSGDARVGTALRWLFEQVTDEPERNERTLLLALLEQYLGSSAHPGDA
ncbi:MAG: HD domain-containing protein [Candidatus Eremiobacteraeota bacterium]|nr:HD domain-containing protein [Candidatus Eremiobacteraeota bacterium]